MVEVMREGDLCWTPDTARIGKSRMTHFMGWLRSERGVVCNDYETLWRWSVDHIAEFWAALWDYFDIISDARFEQVVSGDEMISTRWFSGARVNYAEHLLRHEAEAAPDEVALHHSSEIRPFRTTTWSELGHAVRAVATRLRELGIRPGDRVVSYAPNVPETAVMMLATVSIGAVWSAAAPEFGVRTVVARFAQIRPKVIFAADGYSFGGKRHDRRPQIAQIIAGLPTIEKVVWLPYLGLDVAANLGHRPIAWSELISQPGPSREQFRFERVPSGHPLWVLFSSGTTGLPKAITHSHVGIVLDQLKQMCLHLDLGPGQSMLFYTTTGWMMWNAVLSALFAGAAAVLYDGSPTWPAIDKLWELAEHTGATMFGASPTLVAKMEEAHIEPCKTRDISRLDSVVLGGAPSTASTFEWLYKNVKQDLWVINTSGGTDLCGGLVGAVPIRPVRAAEMQGKILGICVEAWNDAGEPVIDQVGELVVTRPFPSMPLFFWGDENNARYRETYFSTYPGVWRHGDFVKLNERGGAYVYGRADATLNRFGVRIGTSEIYGAVSGINRIVDSIVVCCETPAGGYYMPLFVQLREGLQLDSALVDEIKRTLLEQTSPRHVPDVIIQAPGVPYTLTGKKMEVPLRKILMGRSSEEVASSDAMSNPAVWDWYVRFAGQKDIRKRFASG
jgi:acetoacetyl-CoA synthetase